METYSFDGHITPKPQGSSTTAGKWERSPRVGLHDAPSQNNTELQGGGAIDPGDEESQPEPQLQMLDDEPRGQPPGRE